MTGRNGIHWCASGGSCGKTTALRMVAGPENISAGTLRIAGKPVNNITPKDRDIAMVFQNYALYPHMTVAGNIAFALRMRKPARHLIDAKVRETADIPGLTDWLDRKPDQLSGGQRRRAAAVRPPAGPLRPAARSSPGYGPST